MQPCHTPSCVGQPGTRGPDGRMVDAPGLGAGGLPAPTRILCATWPLAVRLPPIARFGVAVHGSDVTCLETAPPALTRLARTAHAWFPVSAFLASEPSALRSMPPSRCAADAARDERRCSTPARRSPRLRCARHRARASTGPSRSQKPRDDPSGSSEPQRPHRMVKPDSPIAEPSREFGALGRSYSPQNPRIRQRRGGPGLVHAGGRERGRAISRL